MKSLSILLACLSGILTVSAQTWKWPSNPKAGMNVEVLVSGVAETEGPLHVAYLSFEGTKLVATDVGMVPGEHAGEFKVPVPLTEKGSWAALALRDKYADIKSISITKVENDKAQPGAAAIEKALSQTIYARTLGLERNDMESNMLFFEAVHASATWMNEPDVLRGYYQSAKATSTQPDLDYIKNQLKTVADKPKDASEKMIVQSIAVAKDMQDSTLQASLRKGLDKAYPKSILAQEADLNIFKNSDSVEEQIKLREQYKAKYVIDETNQGYLDQMTSTIIQHFAEEEKWDDVKKYVDEIRNPMTKASVCNNYAWKLSGESIEKAGSHYDIAEYLSSTSMKQLTPEVPKPASLTRSEWANNLESYKAMYGDTYALIRFKQGHVDDALDHQLFAVQNNEYGDGDMNERYAIYLEKAGQQKELTSFLEKMIVMGKATPAMKALHKSYWTGKASVEDLYAQYLNQLEARAHEAMVAEVMKKWKSDDAIGFALKDLQGNEVSLNDYRGKTVILDFWATWCGPCKASFPGMKQAVEHYASDKDVVFLFVDTWENPDNVDSRVSRFIEDNQYPFHVLMDRDNKVVGSYKVEGIPTKFVIGPDQKVRFVSVGYGGNPDELFEEMKIMVELARHQGNLSKT